MKNKQVQTFVKLNEAYQTLVNFYLGEENGLGWGDSPLDKLDNALHEVFKHNPEYNTEIYAEACNHIERLNEIISEAMTSANQQANQLIKAQ